MIFVVINLNQTTNLFHLQNVECNKNITVYANRMFTRKISRF